MEAFRGKFKMSSPRHPLGIMLRHLKVYVQVVEVDVVKLIIDLIAQTQLFELFEISSRLLPRSGCFSLIPSCDISMTWIP